MSLNKKRSIPIATFLKENSANIPKGLASQAQTLYKNYIEDYNLHLSPLQTFENLKKIKPHVRENIYMSLLKNFLNQKENLYKILIHDKLEFAKFCLTTNIYTSLLHFNNKNVIDKKEYLFLVLQAYFTSENYKNKVRLISRYIKILAEHISKTDIYFNETRTLDSIFGDKQDFVSSLPQVLAQIKIIFENKLWFENNNEFLYFLQTFYFKKIMNVLTTFGLREAYYTTYIILQFLVDFKSENVGILFDLINHKHNLFIEEYQTIHLILSLCTKLSEIEWNNKLKVVSEFSKKQFLRYVVFVNNRLHDKAGSLKRLIINANQVTFDVEFQAKSFIEALFKKENIDLINNVKIIYKLLDDYLSNEFNMTMNLDQIESYFYLSHKDENLFDISDHYEFKFDLMNFVDDNKAYNEAKLNAFISESKLDNVSNIKDHLKFLIFQYNRCLHPPISLQALNDLKEQESNYCKFTNIRTSIYDEEELKSFPEKVQSIVRDKFKSPFSPKLKLSEYFCSSCTNAYKIICSQPKEFIFNYKDKVDQTIENIEFVKNAKKNKQVSKLFDHACADMRMLNLNSCHKPDENHTNEIKNKK